MPVAARGILLNILLHFWVTECEPLPKDDLQLRYIARSHPPTWRAHCGKVLAVFEALRPDMEAYLERRKRGFIQLSVAGQRGGSRTATQLSKLYRLAGVSKQAAEEAAGIRTMPRERERGEKGTAAEGPPRVVVEEKEGRRRFVERT